ncbi:MAG TPA: hypothetical protein ENJ29_01865 [Bacteroidetes bacterium]|nr:hypothetical protein [Bacteroidota bacterium]
MSPAGVTLWQSFHSGQNEPDQVDFPENNQYEQYQKYSVQVFCLKTRSEYEQIFVNKQEQSCGSGQGIFDEKKNDRAMLQEIIHHRIYFSRTMTDEVEG